MLKEAPEETFTVLIFTTCACIGQYQLGCQNFHSFWEKSTAEVRISQIKLSLIARTQFEMGV